jgi:hypothetical protein
MDDEVAGNRKRAIAAWSVAALLATTAGALALANAWPNDFVGLFSDSVAYLRMADALPPGAGSGAVLAQAHFPPGYPLLLALGGAGLEAVPRAFAVHALTVALAVLAVFAYLRARLGGVVLPLVVAALVAASPGWWLAALKPSSDLLFAACVAAFCLCLTRQAPGASAAVAGAALLVRSAGVALLPAFLVHVVRERSGVRRSMLALAGCLLPAIAWALWQRAAGNTYGGDLLGALQRVQAADAWVPWLQEQGMRALSALAGDGGPRPWLLGALALALAAAGLPRAWRERLPEAVVLPAYLGMVLLWPYPAEFVRLLVPIVPLLPVLAARALHGVSARAAAGAALAAGLLLVAGTPALVARATLALPDDLRAYRTVDSFWRAPDAAGAERAARVTDAFRDALGAVPRAVPPDACVYATTPELAGALAPRRFVSPPAEGDASAMQECDWFLVTLMAPAQGHLPPYYPREAIEATTDVVLQATFPDGPAHGLAAELRVRRTAIRAEPGQ